MKKIYSIVLICLFLLTACTNANTNSDTNSTGTYQYVDSHHDEGHHFVSSMGCEDENCTDSAHYHNCDENCTDPAHYHDCDANCDNSDHHHKDDHHQ